MFDFCAETLATSTKRVDDALDQLRKELAQGLTMGEALPKLTKRVQSIFNDPYRALRIAQTESSRAQHAGQLMAAKESGVVTALEWVASSDCCDRCAELDGQQVALGEPFVVLPGKEAYSIVLHPPLHPGCMCAANEVL